MAGKLVAKLLFLYHVIKLKLMGSAECKNKGRRGPCDCRVCQP